MVPQRKYPLNFSHFCFSTILYYNTFWYHTNIKYIKLYSTLLNEKEAKSVQIGYPQLFRSFSTAFPQLFLSFSLAFPELFYMTMRHTLCFYTLIIMWCLRCHKEKCWWEESKKKTDHTFLRCHNNKDVIIYRVWSLILSKGGGGSWSKWTLRHRLSILDFP